MVIKLVRTDCTEPCKIQLLPGEHIIGRGKLLKCDDKRISRNHGQLLVLDDCLKINALSQNPCFYAKKNSNEIEILKKDCSITLANNDKFGLLPDKFWYEIIYYTNMDIDDKMIADISENNTEEYKTDDPCTSSIETSTKTTFKIPEECNETVDNTERPESPCLIDNNTISLETLQDVAEETENVNNDGCINKSNNECDNSEPCNDSKPNQSPTQAKRSHSLEPEDTKKMKVEPVEVKTEPEDVKPGPSLNQVQDNADGYNNVPVQNIPRLPSRERCMYGVGCYRKNPLHLAQFAHPRDNDWGEGAQLECPYGAACAKRDPRHLRDHSHPPGHRPPPAPALAPAPPPGIQVVHRRGNVFYINANAVNFHDDHFQVVDSDGDSVDYDYEF